MSKIAFSKSRLVQMQSVMKGYVDRGEVPGMVLALSRKGERHAGAMGVKAVGGAPVKRDTLFRITSMTKPITAVAALILIEECKLRLDDAIDRWMPELAERRVLKRLNGPLDETEPARRPITVRDLLTFRLGWGLILDDPRNYPLLQKVEDARIVGFGPPDPGNPHNPDEWLRSLSGLPLMDQPGECWRYNMGSALLGVLIARASGKDLETFCRERIFEPLGMKDTSFALPATHLERFANAYRINAQTKMLELFDDAAKSAWGPAPAFQDGAAGLLSTLDDFLNFAEMLLNFGKHGKEQILSRASVETMTSDQLTDEQKKISPELVPGQWHDSGFGFGVSVTTRRTAIDRVPGQYGWDGGFGTTWRNDPKEQMVGVLLTQRMFESPIPPLVCKDFWTSAYQAIDDE